MSTATMIAASGRSAQTGFIMACGFCLLFYFGPYAGSAGIVLALFLRETGGANARVSQ